MNKVFLHEFVLALLAARIEERIGVAWFNCWERGRPNQFPHGLGQAFLVRIDSHHRLALPDGFEAPYGFL